MSFKQHDGTWTQNRTIIFSNNPTLSSREHSEREVFFTKTTNSEDSEDGKATISQSTTTTLQRKQDHNAEEIIERIIEKGQQRVRRVIKQISSLTYLSCLLCFFLSVRVAFSKQNDHIVTVFARLWRIRDVLLFEYFVTFNGGTFAIFTNNQLFCFLYLVFSEKRSHHRYK